MPKFFVNEDKIDLDKKIVVIEEDVNHIKNVLRMKKGNNLQICVKQTGQNFECEIEEFIENEIMCNIVKIIENNVEPSVHITIFQGLPKAEKMEWIIQKSVEIGVKEIIPIAMDRCVVRLNEKDSLRKIERWQKISEVAAKQSGRDCIPKVGVVTKIKDVYNIFKQYDVVLVAYENERKTTLKDELKNIIKKDDLKIAVVIGPEGGISENEIYNLKEIGARVISLGNRILRTETVALVISSIILYELEN